MVKEMPMVSLFETFIKDTRTGKRRQLNGKRIRPGSIANYEYVLKLLKDYEQYSSSVLSIKTNSIKNQLLLVAEKKKWKEFYRRFSDYLFYELGCFDNYAGSVFKVIKCFFRYLRNEKFLPIQECYEGFYVRREHIRIISLTPERFYFLAKDKPFDESLKPLLRKWKAVLVFGCTTAMRFSDLMHLQVRDIETSGKEYYLHYRSIKTNTDVKMKLPEFAVDIFMRFSKYKKPDTALFPQICLSQFNKDIRKIALQAKWTEPIGKFRNRDGEAVEIGRGPQKIYRFCDLVTSHIMRRTGVTMMLMLGMPEYMVRKISGHAAYGYSFSRYVNFAQSFITDEIDKAYHTLEATYESKKA